MISYTEIIFIIIGAMAVVVGFVMPAGRRGEDLNPEETRKDVKDMVRSSLDAAKNDIHTEIDDTLEESMLSAERSMERITNDKISAISDYAESVLNDIHKNHEEVMFMYDMLNDKQKNLSGIANEVEKKAAEAKATAAEARVAADNARTIAHASAKPGDVIRETANILRNDVIEREERVKSEQEKRIIAEREERLKAEREMLLQQIGQSPTTQFSSSGSGIEQVFSSNRQTAAQKAAALEAVGFAPLEDAIVRIEPETTTDRILSSGNFAKQDETAEAAAELVAKALSSKVVTFSDKKLQHEMEVERLIEEQRKQVVNGDAVDTYTYPVMQNKQQTILHMHNEGMSNVTIARELNMGVGEVRLVLDLMGKHRKIRR